MNYELAKKLKDAGFPQDIKNGDWFYSENERWVRVDDSTKRRVVELDEDSPYVRGNGIDVARPNLSVKKPTLSELISSIKLEEMIIRPIFGVWLENGTQKEKRIGWNIEAKSNPDGKVRIADSYFSEGGSIEEAAAKLWLKLNEK